MPSLTGKKEVRFLTLNNLILAPCFKDVCYDVVFLFIMSEGDVQYKVMDNKSHYYNSEKILGL